MATIKIKNRERKFNHGKVSGVVYDVDLKQDVSVLKGKISQLYNIQADHFDVIYCGHVLKGGQLVESYNIKSGVTVHVFRALQDPDVFITEPMDNDSIQQVLTAIKSSKENSSFRQVVEKIFSNSETLENIIAATPGLSNDPVAIAMLQDPDMLSIMADPDAIKKVIAQHPSIGAAALLVAAAVNEESNSSAYKSRPSNRGEYSIDQMSDDEEAISLPPMRREAQQITHTQLAAALMAAGATSNSQQSTSSSMDSQNISSTQLASALMTAGGASNLQPPSSSTADGSSGSYTSFLQDTLAQISSQSTDSEEQMKEKLTQLREMGITDELVARQALEATGGNLMAALELIFGDQMMS